MIPGVHEDDEGDGLYGVLNEMIRAREVLAVPGQVECPRPHQNLFVEGSRCYCGAQV